MSAPALFKRCSRCGEEKPVSDFVWRKPRAAYGYHCRSCRAEYGRDHYAANRQIYKARASQRKRRLLQERTAYLLDYFVSHPCSDCGERDPVVLDFDHLRDKQFNISEGLAGHNWAVVLEEMRKCEVVCANCHRRRTAQRLGSVRAVLSGLAAGGLDTRD